MTSISTVAYLLLTELRQFSELSSLTDSTDVYWKLPKLPFFLHGAQAAFSWDLLQKQVKKEKKEWKLWKSDSWQSVVGSWILTDMWGKLKIPLELIKIQREACIACPLSKIYSCQHWADSQRWAKLRQSILVGGEWGDGKKTAVKGGG